MAILFTADEFCNKLLDIAKNYKTLYVMGCFGAPMNDTNKKRYTTNHSYNKKADRAKMIMSASADTFGFDCVCLIKGVLWGWNGDVNAVYGGAKYNSNGVPDVGTEEILKYCSDLSADFSKIAKGELVYMKGHVGIYVGDGNVVECSPAWKNKVQITKLTQRKWLKHGYLRWIDYGEVKPSNTINVETVNLPEDSYVYSTAKEALGDGMAKVKYKAGDYYVYKVSGNATNITKNIGKAGGWIATYKLKK